MNEKLDYKFGKYDLDFSNQIKKLMSFVSKNR